MPDFTVIAEDCAVQVSVSTSAPTAAPVYPAAASIKGIARRVSVRETTDLINTRALGQQRNKYRTTGGQTEIRVEQFVGSSGWAYFSTTTFLGRVVRIELKELSTMLAFKVWEGVINEWNGEFGLGEAQVETLVATCDADHA